VQIELAKTFVHGRRPVICEEEEEERKVETKEREI